MEAFKRVYSNAKTEEQQKTIAQPWLWENFDAENHSIWLATYKFPEDLKMVFMASNLVAGMFQRLDRLHKHAFSSVCINGHNGDLQISGIWIFKGHKVAFEVSLLHYSFSRFHVIFVTVAICWKDAINWRHAKAEATAVHSASQGRFLTCRNKSCWRHCWLDQCPTPPCQETTLRIVFVFSSTKTGTWTHLPTHSPSLTMWRTGNSSINTWCRMECLMGGNVLMPRTSSEG